MSAEDPFDVESDRIENGATNTTQLFFVKFPDGSGVELTCSEDTDIHDSDRRDPRLPCNWTIEHVDPATTQHRYIHNEFLIDNEGDLVARIDDRAAFLIRVATLIHDDVARFLEMNDPRSARRKELIKTVSPEDDDNYGSYRRSAKYREKLAESLESLRGAVGSIRIAKESGGYVVTFEGLFCVHLDVVGDDIKPGDDPSTWRLGHRDGWDSHVVRNGELLDNQGRVVPRFDAFEEFVLRVATLIHKNARAFVRNNNPESERRYAEWEAEHRAKVERNAARVRATSNGSN